MYTAVNELTFQTMFINFEHVQDCEQVDNIKHGMNILRHLKETPLEQGRETSNTPVPQMDRTARDAERAGEVKVSHILKQVFTTQ